jgi:hypothetical protein
MYSRRRICCLLETLPDDITHVDTRSRNAAGEKDSERALPRHLLQSPCAVSRRNLCRKLTRSSRNTRALCRASTDGAGVVAHFAVGNGWLMFNRGRRCPSLGPVSLPPGKGPCRIAKCPGMVICGLEAQQSHSDGMVGPASAFGLSASGGGFAALPPLVSLPVLTLPGCEDTSCVENPHDPLLGSGERLTPNPANHGDKQPYDAPDGGSPPLRRCCAGLQPTSYFLLPT